MGPAARSASAAPYRWALVLSGRSQGVRKSYWAASSRSCCKEPALAPRRTARASRELPSMHAGATGIALRTCSMTQSSYRSEQLARLFSKALFLANAQARAPTPPQPFADRQRQQLPSATMALRRLVPFMRSACAANTGLLSCTARPAAGLVHSRTVVGTECSLARRWLRWLTAAPARLARPHSAGWEVLARHRMSAAAMRVRVCP